MRILLMVDPEIPVPPVTYGGIERIVDGLVRGLMRNGHDVALIAREGSTCPATRLFAWPGSTSQSVPDTLRNSWCLARAVWAFRPDVIHSFSRLAYLLPHLRGKRPIIMSYQREPSLRTVGLSARLAAPGILTFTGCSEYIAARGRRAGGHWSAIPNFVDTARLTFQPAVARDAPLLFLSRVESIKGADMAIEIARRCGRRLLIAGNHAEDGGEGAYWHDKIVPHLGRDGVDYVGPVDDIQKDRLLGEAGALLVPIQWNEPFGIVFAEALACGTPVISCPRGALPEIVRHGQEGFLIETVDEACAAIAQLDDVDRAACRQRAEQEFSLEIGTQRYLRLYHQLLGHSGSDDERPRS
jgi:glycosyltransferase involved in cell wall biosynthesis